MKYLSCLVLATLFLALGCNDTTETADNSTPSSVSPSQEKRVKVPSPNTNKQEPSKTESKKTNKDETGSNDARKILAAALKSAKSSDKNLLVHFGAPG